MSLKYNDDMGKVYDTAFFMTMCSREDDFFTLLRNRFANSININEAMKGFFDFKERYKSIVASETEPFVYTDYQTGLHSFLVNTIHYNLDYSSYSKDGVISFLQDRNLKRLFWEHFFPRKKDQIAERLYNNDRTLNIPDLITSLNIPEDIKIRLVDISHDFPKYQWKLLEIFKEIYSLINEYHSEKQNLFDDIRKQLDNTVIDKLYKIHNLPSASKYIPFYSSTLNGLLFDCRSLEKKVCFGLGLHFKEVIESIHQYNHVSFNSFSKILHVETRSEMLDMFFRYKRLCASEIAHELHISKSTIHLHLNAMLLEEMIGYADSDDKNRGERVYYAINSDYFKAFAGISANANKKAYDNISKGIDRYDLPRKRRKAKDGLIYNDNDEYDEEEVE